MNIHQNRCLFLLAILAMTLGLHSPFINAQSNDKLDAKVGLRPKSSSNVEIELYGALPYTRGSIVGSDKEPQRKPRDLYLSTVFSQEQWDWVMGMAMDYNRAIHRGRILKGSLNDESGIVIEMDIKGDPWIKGGRAEYTLALGPENSEGERHGTYKGVFRGVPVEGKVVLRTSKPLVSFEGYQKPAWDEHPRLLFRKSELDALKERAKTPLGKAFVEKMKQWKADPVSLGMLYQLTGDQHYADQAMNWVDKQLSNENAGAFSGAAGDYGKRVGNIALVFDLCYDAWPDRFRQKVIATTAWRMQRMMYSPTSISRSFNWSFNSNWSGHMNAGAGMAGLTMFDKPQLTPVLPPLKLGKTPRVFKALENVTTTADSPVNSFEAGKLPLHWLFCGPFPNRTEQHFPILKDKGGVIKAIPEVGDEVTYDGVSHSFEKLGENGFWDYQGGVIELMGATNRTFHSSQFFFTMLEVEKEQLVQFWTGAAGGHPIVYLNGERIIQGEPLVLKKGLHKLMIRNHFYQINPWGKAWLKPVFVEITPEAAKKRLDFMHDRYLIDRSVYEENKAYSEANHGASAEYRWLSMVAFRKTQLFHRYTFGDGGFQVEGERYTSVGSNEPILWESLYKSTFGQPSSGRPDVTHFGPRYVAQTLYNDKGIHAHQSFSLEDGSRNVREWNLIYPATAPEMQGAALWGWNKALGIPNGGLGKSARDRGDDQAFIDAVTKKLHPVKGFLYYPMDKVPVRPEKELPKVWQAKTKGLYVFRNGWNGPQDIVTQVFLKSEGSGGWDNPDAGAIRLWGLGHLWTHRGNKPAGSKTVKRWHESVVQLPEDVINDDMGASLISHDARSDGSGFVAMDMKYVYMGPKRKLITEGKQKGQFENIKKYNNMFRVNEDLMVDLGIQGKRMVAVDYSGKSGAPALITMVDHISGGGEKIWTWQLPGGGKTAGQGISKRQVKITSDGFLIDKGNATLKVTFISPAKPNVRFADRAIDYDPNNNTAKRQRARGEDTKSKASLNCIWVSDSEDKNNGNFFAIITLQRKDAPAISVIEGKGLEAKIKVGDAQVQVLGDKIVIK